MDIENDIVTLVRSPYAEALRYGHGISHSFLSDAHRLFVRRWEGNGQYTHSVHYLEQCVYLSRSRDGKDFTPDCWKTELPWMTVLSHISRRIRVPQKKISAQEPIAHALLMIR